MILHRTSKLLLILVAWGLLVGCSPSAVQPTEVAATSTPEAATTSSRSIVISEVSDEPSETIEEFQPLADYLAENLSDFEIDSGEVFVAPNVSTIITRLRNGEVDVYFDSVYPAMVIADASGARPVLRRWKDNVEEYHTVIFANRERAASLEDLRGQIVVFEEDTSTSGYMLPLAYLLERGFKMQELSDVEQTVAEDSIGYVFSTDDDNTTQWVISGRAAAGALDNVTFAEIPQETRDQLTILLETESLPRHLVLVAPNLEPELVQAIMSLLVGLDEADNGAEILESIDDTARFDEFPEGIDAALARMNEMYTLVQESANGD